VIVRGDAVYLREDFAPVGSGKGSTTSRTSVGSMSSTPEDEPDSETQEGAIHLLGLQPHGRVRSR
jgi:hypothetical protein